MKKYYTRISFWFSISLFILLSACHSSKNKPCGDEPTTIKEQPKPLTDYQTDSLKNYLDAERARRLKK